MSFLEGLLAGRSHLAVLAGLALAAATIGAVRRVGSGAAPAASLEAVAPAADAPPLRRPGPLDARERTLADAAWAYVVANTDAATGLAPAVRGHPAATLWDLGSQLLAVISAEDLGLVSPEAGGAALGSALRSLARLPLCEGGLPNKSYDTRTLAMVRADGAPAPDGVGWSALDVSRLLLALSVVGWRHPELQPLVRRTVSRWNLDALSDGASLRGGVRGVAGALRTEQEGRLGYEQHAAKALLPWGISASTALDYRAHLAFARVHGQPLPRDARDPRDHGGVPAALVAEPWLLDALENGFDAVTLPVARALLAAQERRHRETGRLTAVSEDALDRAPWFAFSAVLDGDEPWVALGPDGKPLDGALTFSTKAAVAFGVLFEGDYAEALLAEAARLVSPGEGLYAGRYDATWEVNRALSLNTNAVVLEALAYRVRGPAVRAARTGAEEARP